MLQQIANLQLQLDALRSAVSIAADGTLQVDAVADRKDRTGGNLDEKIGNSRTIAIGVSDSLKVGTNRTVTVNDADTPCRTAFRKRRTPRQAMPDVLMTADGTIVIKGAEIQIQATDVLTLQAGGAIIFRAPLVATNP